MTVLVLVKKLEHFEVLHQRRTKWHLQNLHQSNHPFLEWNLFHFHFLIVPFDQNSLQKKMNSRLVSGQGSTKRIIIVRPLFLDGPEPDSMRTSHKTGNSSSSRGSLIQMPKLWKIISNFFWPSTSLSNM